MVQLQDNGLHKLRNKWRKAILREDKCCTNETNTNARQRHNLYHNKRTAANSRRRSIKFQMSHMQTDEHVRGWRQKLPEMYLALDAGKLNSISFRNSNTGSASFPYLHSKTTGINCRYLFDEKKNLLNTITASPVSAWWITDKRRFWIRCLNKFDQQDKYHTGFFVTKKKRSYFSRKHAVHSSCCLANYHSFNPWLVQHLGPDLKINFLKKKETSISSETWSFTSSIHRNRKQWNIISFMNTLPYVIHAAYGTARIKIDEHKQTIKKLD